MIKVVKLEYDNIFVNNVHKIFELMHSWSVENDTKGFVPNVDWIGKRMADEYLLVYALTNANNDWVGYLFVDKEEQYTSDLSFFVVKHWYLLPEYRQSFDIRHTLTEQFNGQGRELIVWEGG